MGKRRHRVFLKIFSRILFTFAGNDDIHKSFDEFEIIVKSLDPLRAKKTFIRKKLAHTMVSAIKASSVTL